MSTTAPGRRPCKLCGMALLFAPGPSGAVLPLQRLRTLYTFGDAGEVARKVEELPEEVYVSHFETCPLANAASKKAKAKVAARKGAQKGR
jgi:hypothetical protein